MAKKANPKKINASTSNSGINQPLFDFIQLFVPSLQADDADELARETANLLDFMYGVMNTHIPGIVKGDMGKEGYHIRMKRGWLPLFKPQQDQIDHFDKNRNEAGFSATALDLNITHVKSDDPADIDGKFKAEFIWADGKGFFLEDSVFEHFISKLKDLVQRRITELETLAYGK